MDHHQNNIFGELMGVDCLRLSRFHFTMLHILTKLATTEEEKEEATDLATTTTRQCISNTRAPM
jgi:hypothetical protein